MQRASERCALFIKGFESLELEAYPDPGSELGQACAARGLPMAHYFKVPNYVWLKGAPWTIGWGHTGSEVHRGLRWTQHQCEAAFESDLMEMERDVCSLLKVPATQGQFDALVSFAFNCGPDIDADDKAEGLGDSTLLRLLNAGDYQGAANEFPKWNRSGGKVIGGLVRRRDAERAMFLTP